jgi:predicted O-methyltransferase YrrM
MTFSLNTPEVSAVLRRLVAAEAHDEETFATIGDSLAAPFDLDVAQRAEFFKDVYMSVSPEGGQLLYLLARATGARSIVEYGTSFGLSTIYLAAAVRDNGGGTVVGTELQSAKAFAAQRNFADAGLADLIDLRVGDARETLQSISQPIDLLLLDGWPDLALPVLQLLEPKLRVGSLILVDDVDVDFGRDVHGPLLKYLDDSANGYLTLKLPIADGIQASVRLTP